MSKSTLERRYMRDAPAHYNADEAVAWADGWNSAIDALLNPADRKLLKIGNKQHEVRAARAGAFLLTAAPSSLIWCDMVGYVRHVALEVHGNGAHSKPVVTLRGRKE